MFSCATFPLFKRSFCIFFPYTSFFFLLMTVIDTTSRISYFSDCLFLSPHLHLNSRDCSEQLCCLLSVFFKTWLDKDPSNLVWRYSWPSFGQEVGLQTSEVSSSWKYAVSPWGCFSVFCIFSFLLSFSIYTLSYAIFIIPIHESIHEVTHFNESPVCA